MPNIKRIIFVAIPFLLAASGALFYIGYSKRVLSGPVTISIYSSYINAPVFINDQLVGNTPYKGQKTISSPLNISIKGEYSSFQTTVRPSPGTEISVSRDLGVSSKFSSGQMVYLEKSNAKNPSISVISNPSGALVKIDGVEIGKTPIALSDPNIIKPDKDHKIELSLDGLEGQSLTVTPKSGYLANVVFDLAILPIQENPKELPESTSTAKIFSIVNPALYQQTPKDMWIKAIDYYKKTRGNALVEFNYFVDEEGLTYKSITGELVNLDSFTLPEDIKEPIIVGVLKSVSGPLSEKTLASVGKIFGTKELASSKNMVVTETGTDFGLNVRSGSGVQFEKIGQIKVGTQVTVLEESGAWAKVKFDGTKEGWVSSAYLSSK